MPSEQNHNRNAWAQLTQGNDYAAFQQQTYVPGGYGRVPSYAPSQGYFLPQGYTLAGSYDGYGGSSNSYINPYSAHESQRMSSNIIGADDILDQEVDDIISQRPRKQVRKRESRAPAESEVKPRSKRSLLRERVALENNGEVSANNLPKGLVEWREGVLMWWDPEDQMWLKAAYHDEYRDQFIQEDAQAVGNYVFAPAAGKADNDVTSCCATFNQLSWNLTDRDSWANIIDSDGQAILYLLERPSNQSYDPPDRLWLHDGNVLLDSDNNPVRPWVGIPRCFSSKLEGGRMEALRRILPMTIQDFRARMPRIIQTSAGLKPLPYPSTFGHRLSRFRDRYQISAFVTRAASDVRKRQIIEELPKTEEATTTEGLQVLTRHEIERRKLSTRGQFLYKANGRTISEDERKRRDRKLHEKLARQAEGLQEPQSTPATLGQSTSRNPDLARPPLSVNTKRRRQDDLEDIDPGLSEPVAKRSRRGATSLEPTLVTPLPTLFEADHEQAPQKYEEANTTATASKNTPLPAPIEPDHRFIEPQTPLEQLRVQAALFYPRAHYYALIREYPPHTSEGTYIDQYWQIVALLEQKWLLPGQAPPLADIGPWHGSFDTVPAPILEDGVMWSILHPDISSAIESEVESSSQGSDVEEGAAENVGTNPGADIGAGHDDAEWDGGYFYQFLETEGGDGGFFGDE